MRNNYNLIAPFYDIGVQLLFGRGIFQSYAQYLDQIKATQSVLIVGGGSGRLLPMISDDANIDYVELSGAMIKQARNQRTMNIEYYREDFLEFDTNVTYDWILFPFFLDLFTEVEIGQILAKSQSLLNSKGRLIVSDFDKPRTLGQKALLAFSIISLRSVVSLEIKRLAAILKVLEEEGYRCMAKKIWAKGFIFSAIFKKRETFD